MVLQRILFLSLMDSSPFTSIRQKIQDRLYRDVGAKGVVALVQVPAGGPKAAEIWAHSGGTTRVEQALKGCHLRGGSGRRKGAPILRVCGPIPPIKTQAGGGHVRQEGDVRVYSEIAYSGAPGKCLLRVQSSINMALNRFQGVYDQATLKVSLQIWSEWSCERGLIVEQQHHTEDTCSVRIKIWL